MSGQTKCITEMDHELLLLVWYVLVDDAYRCLEKRHGKWRRRGPAPQFSDSEVLVVGMACDTFFAGNEEQGLAWIRQHLLHLFPRLPSNGHFNERRTILGPLCEQVRQLILAQQHVLNAEDPYRIIDSAPIPLCTYQRGGACQSYDPAFGIRDFAGYANKSKSRFMGYRLMALVSTSQVIDQWMLTPANFHDSVAMSAMLEETHNCCLLGDGAFHEPYAEALAATKRNTIVLAPPRKNSRKAKWSPAFKRIFSYLRRAIETTFSSLTLVFHLEQPGARSLKGFVCRISSKILAYTLCLVTNRWLNTGFIAETQN
jgi:hypothetical protein